MARFVELSREISNGMGGINPSYAVRVRPLTAYSIRAFAEIMD